MQRRDTIPGGKAASSSVGVMRAKTQSMTKREVMLQCHTG
jgi:hypothetical protein